MLEKSGGEERRGHEKEGLVEKRQIIITGNFLLSDCYILGAALNAACSLSHLGLHKRVCRLKMAVHVVLLLLLRDGVQFPFP